MFTIHKDGYDTLTQSITVTNVQQLQNLKFFLVQSVIDIVVSGHVVDKTSLAKIPDAEIILTHNNYSSWQQTNESGFFNFSIKSTKLDISKPFLFTIHKDRYDSFTQSITVTNVQQLQNLQFLLEKAKQYRITVTGKVFNREDEQLIPLSHADIKLIYEEQIIEKTSMDDGSFSSEIYVNDENRELRFVIQKDLYKDLDTTINIDTIGIEKLKSSSNLSLIMTYMDGVTKVNFFPIQVGNKWEYEAVLQTGDNVNSRIKKGIDRWEIISIDENNNTFKMKSTFNGMYIYPPSISSSSKDTTYYTDIVNILTLSMISGQLKLIDYEMSNDKYQPSKFIHDINFIQPYREGVDTNIETGQKMFYHYIYTLRYGVGLMSLHADHMSLAFDWEYSDYKLISFNGNSVESGR